MDAPRLASLYVSYVNDEIAIQPYAHGFLVALPVTYWDDDAVTLFIEPFHDGFKVSDRGSTAVRLHMTGMNITTPRVTEAWARSVASLNLLNPTDEDLELAHFATTEQLGEAITKVAEASVRIDQLRWLHTAQNPAKFPDKVVKRLGRAAGDRVRPNAPLKLRHGRERHVTAAVLARPEHEIFVQAVGGNTKDAKERAVEHCTYLFNQAADLDDDQRLAVVAGKRQDAYFINTLAESSAVAFFDEPDELDRILHERLATA